MLLCASLGHCQGLFLVRFQEGYQGKALFRRSVEFYTRARRVVIMSLKLHLLPRAAKLRTGVRG